MLPDDEPCWSLSPEVDTRCAAKLNELSLEPDVDVRKNSALTEIFHFCAYPEQLVNPFAYIAAVSLATMYPDLMRVTAKPVPIDNGGT